MYVLYAQFEQEQSNSEISFEKISKQMCMALYMDVEAAKCNAQLDTSTEQCKITGLS